MKVWKWRKDNILYRRDQLRGKYRTRLVKGNFGREYLEIKKGDTRLLLSGAWVERGQQFT